MEGFMRRTTVFTVAIASIATVLVGLSVPATGQAPVTAFEGARIIVGDGSPAIEKGTIVVNGTTIQAIGANVQVPAGAQRVNLAGKTVMPMILDTHIHAPATREQMIRDLRRRVYWGVGAAMSMGTDTTDVVFKVRDETKNMPGTARLLTAGRGVTGIEKGREQSAYWVGTVAEARKAVQENAMKRPDIIKIWVDDRDNTVPKLTPELYGAIIDEAHKQKVRVTAHIFDLEDGKGLLKANVDAFAHSVRDRDVDPEFLSMMKQRPNVTVNPNLPSPGKRWDISWLQGRIAADEFANVQKANVDDPKQAEAYGIQARNLKKLSDQGARIVLGTDGNIPWAPHQEMEAMAMAGMTPMQVIVAATSRAAEFLRITDTGTLQTGKNADLIVLDANPLENITNTRRINAVYFRGQTVNRSAYPN
jgi:imidazolonepropionase-like amidohydrolase